MIIQKVELINIGPHKHLEVNLGPGLTGILGRNGGGKSTLVNSIYAGLTNDFERLAPTKSKLIRNNADFNDQSIIRIEGLHRDQSFTIERDLKSSRGSKLIFDGKSYDKAADVNELLESQLGITKHMIKDYVFVDQWQMFSFLDQSPSNRAQSFQYLCGLQSIEQVYNACRSYVTQHKNVGLVDNRSQLAQYVNEASEELESIRKEYSSIKSAVNKLKEGAEAREAILQRHRYASAARNKLDNIVNDREILNVKIKDLTKSARLEKAELAKLKSEITEFEETENFKKAIEVQTNKKQIEQTIRNLNSAIDLRDSLEAKLAKLKASRPEPHVDLIEEAELDSQRNQLAKFVGQLDVLGEFFKHSENIHDTCPLCNQKVNSDFISKTETKYKKVKSGFEALRVRIKNSEAYIKDIRDYEHNLNNLEDKIDTNQANIDTYLSYYPQEILDFYASSNAVIKEYSFLKKSLEAKIETCSDIKEKINSLSSKLDALSDSNSLVKGLLEAVENAPSKKEREEAERLNDKLSQLAKRLAEKKGQGIKAKESLRKATEALRVHEEQIAKHQRSQELVRKVEQAKSIFAKDALPKAVAQASLASLIADVNENLALFNHPFFVEAGDNLTFKAYLPGNPNPIDAQQLSGGQKVILAVAFRGALDRVFGHNVGMLFLDEPTAGLDEDNVKYFHTALSKMSEKLGKNRQLVIITHVQDIGELFDNTVVIGS